MADLRGKLLRSRQIILSDGIVNGGISVNEVGQIEALLSTAEECEKFVNERKVEVVDVGDVVVMPGVVDSHVHVNEPGREKWEGFSTATAAAAAGGVTTIVDMPLNSIPPTTTLENLKIKAETAAPKIFVDVAFWGGVVPGNQGELLKMVKAGVVGFKCFLCPSGVEEFQHVTEKDLVAALKELDKTDSLLAFHAECDGKYESEQLSDPEDYRTYLHSRPPQMEIEALEIVSKMASAFRTRLHIVHLSAAEGISILKDMRQSRKDAGDTRHRHGVTAETCYHYLTLEAETVPVKRSDFKCAPPVRSAKNKEALWKGLIAGDIDIVVSDHSPCTPNLKTDNFLTAWGGISSLQFGLSLLWTEGRKRGLTLTDISKMISGGPSTLCKLDHRKGSIKPNADADLIIFDPNDSFVVTTDIIRHKNKLTPYAGMTLTGRVLKTYLRGKLIYENQRLLENPIGQLLLNQ